MEKIYEGHWLVPNLTDAPVAGVLTIGEPSPTLRVFGTLSSHSQRSSIELITELPDYEVVHGFCSGTKITILRAMVIGQSGGFRPSEETIKGGLVIEGAHLNGNDHLFESIKFEILGLEEWFDFTCLKGKFNQDEANSITFYADSEERSVIVNKSTTLRYGYNINVHHSRKDFSLSQIGYFEITPKEPMPLRWVLMECYKIRGFLQFCFGTEIAGSCLTGVPVCNDDEGENAHPIIRDVKIFDPYLLQPGKDFPRRHEIPVPFEALREFLGTVMEGWGNLWENEWNFVNLFFDGIREERYWRANRFLSLVQGLEIYHRRNCKMQVYSKITFSEIKKRAKASSFKEHRKFLDDAFAYANEPRLYERLKDLFAHLELPFESAEDANLLIRKIVDTRNYHTHFTERLKGKALDIKEMHSLMPLLLCVYRLLILDKLGIDKQEARKFILGSNSFHNGWRNAKNVCLKEV